MSAVPSFPYANNLWHWFGRGQLVLLALNSYQRGNQLLPVKAKPSDHARVRDYQTEHLPPIHQVGAEWVKAGFR